MPRKFFSEPYNSPSWKKIAGRRRLCIEENQWYPATIISRSRFRGRVFKAAKSALRPSSASNCQLTEGEIILDVDATILQPVLQHIGISACPDEYFVHNWDHSFRVAWGRWGATCSFFETLGVFTVLNDSVCAHYNKERETLVL